MKISTVFIVLTLAILVLSCGKKNTTVAATDKTTTDTTATTFDSTLAQQLGADDYGMKKYVMAFLKAGPNRSQDDSTAAALQQAHLKNIMRLAEEGKLVLAGPFMDRDSVRGIYLFDVESIEEAQQLTATDPAIKAGRLRMELHPWYGSAAVGMVNDWHQKISKKSITN